MKCASCGEFNSRLDRECGECGAPLDVALVEVDEFEKKRAAVEESEVPPAPRRLPASRLQRIAGWILLAHAALVIAMVARFATKTDLVSLAIDAALGISLARGSRRFIPLVLFRLVMGALIAFAAGGGLPALASVAFCAGVIALIIGEPGAPRRLFATAALAGSIFLRVQTLLLPQDVVDEVLKKAIQPSLPEGAQKGAALAYQVDLPYGWRRGAARENEDAVFFQNGGNAAVIVSFEEEEDVCIDAAFHNYTAAMKEYEAKLLGTEEVEGQTDRRSLGRLTWTFQGEPVEAFLGLHVGGRHQFWVRATCTKCDDTLRKELREIATSLRFPADEPELPSNVEPTPVSHITIPETRYWLELPRGWYRRKPSEPTNHAHFLTRVNRDVHLFVDVFPASAAASADKLMRVQLDAMKDDGDMDGFEPKPWPGHEKSARLASGSWNRDEGKLSVRLGAVGGQRPFVVMVFANPRASERLDGELARIFASLQRTEGP